MRRLGNTQAELAGNASFPCTPQAAKCVRRYIRSHLATLPDAVVYDIALLACELVTNSVLHSQPAGPDELGRRNDIGLTIARIGPKIRVEVTDAGSDKNVPHVAEATDEHGRGLTIVRALSDDWGVERLEGQTTVCFEKAISAESEPAPNPVLDQLAAMTISPSDLAKLAISPHELASESNADGEDSRAS